MQTPSSLGVSSQLALGTPEMTFWDQGIPEEALVISCPLCYSTCGAPLDPWPHWRIILIFLMAKEFCLVKGWTLPTACSWLGWAPELLRMLCKAGQFSKMG